jgi:hypothetical protein
MLGRIFEDRFGCPLNLNEAPEEEEPVYDDPDLPRLEKELKSILRIIYTKLTTLDRKSRTCKISPTIFIEFISASSLFSSLSRDQMIAHYIKVLGTFTLALLSLDDFERIFYSMLAFQYCEKHDIEKNAYENTYSIQQGEQRMTGKGWNTRQAVKKLTLTYQIYEPPCLMHTRSSPDKVVSPRAMIPKFSNARKFNEGHARRPQTAGAWSSPNHIKDVELRPATTSALSSEIFNNLPAMGGSANAWGSQPFSPIKIESFRTAEVAKATSNFERPFDIQQHRDRAIDSLSHMSLDMGRSWKENTSKRNSYVSEALLALPQNEALQAVFKTIKNKVAHEHNATNNVQHACVAPEQSHARWLVHNAPKPKRSTDPLGPMAPSDMSSTSRSSFRSSFSRQKRNHRRLTNKKEQRRLSSRQVPALTSVDARKGAANPRPASLAIDPSKPAKKIAAAIGEQAEDPGLLIAISGRGRLWGGA